MNSEKKFYPYIFHPRRGYQGLVTEIKNEKFLSRNEIETKPKKKKKKGDVKIFIDPNLAILRSTNHYFTRGN